MKYVSNTLRNLLSFLLSLDSLLKPEKDDVSNKLKRIWIRTYQAKKNRQCKKNRVRRQGKTSIMAAKSIIERMLSSNKENQ
jgi:hypothetical protein